MIRSKQNKVCVLVFFAQFIRKKIMTKINHRNSIKNSARKNVQFKILARILVRKFVSIFRKKISRLDLQSRKITLAIFRAGIQSTRGHSKLQPTGTRNRVEIIY